MRFSPRFISSGCAIVLAAMFLLAAVFKNQSLPQFATTLDGLGAIPAVIRHWLVIVVPLNEILCFVLLAFRQSRALGFVWSALTLVGFSVYLTYQIYHPTPDGCACFGVMEYDWTTLGLTRSALARNLVFLSITAAGLFFLKKASREGTAASSIA